MVSIETVSIKTIIFVLLNDKIRKNEKKNYLSERLL